MADGSNGAKKINSAIDSGLWKLIGGLILLVLFVKFLGYIILGAIVIVAIAVAVWAVRRQSATSRELQQYRRNHP